MAQSLLYAMFALVIIIAVMALCGTVRLNQSKQQAVQIMTTAALEARQAHKSTTFAGLTNCNDETYPSFNVLYMRRYALITLSTD